MPNKSLSVLKRLRQSEKRNLRNKSMKSSMKTQIKKVVKEVENKNKDNAQKELSTAFKLIDKAAATNAIHKNQAARKKSKLAKKVASLEIQNETAQ